MARCYVVLRHCPNADAPEHMVTTLAGVTSTLFLAEKFIVTEFRTDGLTCYIWPDSTNAREYYKMGTEEDMAFGNVEHYTVEEKTINDDWASI